jgi:xylulokinase
MKKKNLIGIDIGSTNTKVMICNKNCEVLANESEENNIYVNKLDWVEYNPNEWWDRVKRLIKRCMDKTQIKSSSVAGIGISSLGATSVVVDEYGEPVYNAIPWSDGRAKKEVENLKKYESKILKVSGNIPSLLNITPHIIWYKENNPDIYNKIYKFMEPSGFIGCKLTGKFTLDWTFASGTCFGFDYKKLDYDKNLIKLMGLDIEKFPTLHRNTECIGEITKKAAKETGLEEGIRVFIGGHDVIAAAVGAGVIYPGQGYFSVGSAANLLIMTNKDIVTPYMLSIIHIVGPAVRVLDGVQGSVGFSLKWFRDNLGNLERKISESLGNLNCYEILTAEAEKAKPGSGGIIYLPFLFGKFHPDFMKDTTSIFFGITSNSTRGQIIRSIMEGTIFNMYENLKTALDLNIKIDEIITNGGPTRCSLWCQIISDITNKKVLTLSSPEGSLFGNIILAGVGSELFESFDDIIERFVVKGRVFEPNEKNHNLYERLFKIYKDISKSLKYSFVNLKNVKDDFNLIF